MATGYSPPLRVAIIGAGLGGLIFALFLQKTCPEVCLDIYESAHELSEIGAGISVWPRTLDVLKYLDLEDDLLQAAGLSREAPPPFVIRKADQQDAVDAHTFTLLMQTFHRSQFLNALVNHLRTPDEVLHLRKRLASYEEPVSPSDPVVMRFTDGTSATCDLLIGSDGIRSAVRRSMYTSFADEADGESAEELRSMIEPVWSGSVAYRGLAKGDKLPEDIRQYVSMSPGISIGKLRNVVSYPISRGELINVAAIVNTPGGEGTIYEGQWVAPADAEEVVKHFTSWDPRIRTLIRAMERPLLWSINTVKVLPSYVKGRVVLMGDAAHAMTPNQGSGAGQAVEDGFVLASILSHRSVTRENLAVALQVYDTIRRPIAQDVQLRSRNTGRLWHLLRGGWEDVTPEESARGEYPRELIARVGTLVDTEFAWVSETSVLDDQERAMRMLEELLGA